MHVLTDNLDNWFTALKQEDEHTSKMYRQQFSSENLSDDLLNRYILSCAIHEFKWGSIKACYQLLNQLSYQECKPEIHFLRFMYLGLYEKMNHQYVQAVKMYEQAELYLDSMADKEVIGMFHYRKGTSYYYLDIHALSLYHADKASELFQQIDADPLNMAKVFALKGLNYVELQELNLAEENLKKAAAIAKKINFDHSLHYVFDLALIYFKRNEDVAVVNSLASLISFSSHIVYFSSTVVLLEALYRLNCVSQAYFLYSKAYHQAHQSNNTEYLWKLTVVHAKYQKPETYETACESAIYYFQEKKQYNNMREFSEQLSYHYIENNNIEKFLVFHKLSLAQGLE